MVARAFRRRSGRGGGAVRDYAFVIVSSSRASFDALKFGVGAERIPIVPHSVAATAAAVQDARHHA